MSRQTIRVYNIKFLWRLITGGIQFQLEDFATDIRKALSTTTDQKEAPKNIAEGLKKLLANKDLLLSCGGEEGQKGFFETKTYLLYKDRDYGFVVRAHIQKPDIKPSLITMGHAGLFMGAILIRLR